MREDFQKIVSQRIRARLEVLETTARALSRRAGLSKDGIQEILNGRNRNPSFSYLTKIAEAAECDLEYLTGQQDYPRKIDLPGDLNDTIPVVGTVEAGVFSEMSGPEPWLGEYDFDRIRAPKSQSYPSAQCFAFRVSGDSMNSARPRPILEGDFVLCVDVVDAELGVVDDEIYVVRRTKDDGQSFEWTLKRARVFRNRIDLVPESTNPVHKTISIPLNNQAAVDHDHGEEIKIIGLMYGLYAPFGRYS